MKIICDEFFDSVWRSLQQKDLIPEIVLSHQSYAISINAAPNTLTLEASLSYGKTHGIIINFFLKEEEYPWRIASIQSKDCNSDTLYSMSKLLADLITVGNRCLLYLN